MKESNEVQSNCIANQALTRQDVANLLRVSPGTVSRYVAAGVLKKISLTKRSYRITRESVETLLAGKAAEK